MRCGTCRWWGAREIDIGAGDGIDAPCLNEKSPYHEALTSPDDSCVEYEEGEPPE